MRITAWLLGLLLIAACIAVEMIAPLGLFMRWAMPLLLGCFFVLFRIMRGPTIADRVAAISVLGILFIGFCSVLAVVAQRDIFIDIAIAWALQTAVGILVLSKYLEGKHLDD